MIALARQFDDDPDRSEATRELTKGQTYEAFVSRWFVAAMAPTVYWPSAQAERAPDTEVAPSNCSQE